MKHANSLIHEKSPYLLQHAYNPIEWYPWSDSALHKATIEKKPIFLSIGYAACHWCHVMEKETFENTEIADILNSNFISIKVDREERPDLDELYIRAVQIIAGNAGWPLTVFLTPQLQPFFGGTYFPPYAKAGRQGFKSILQSIIALWEFNRSAIIENALELSNYLHNSTHLPSNADQMNKDALCDKGITSLMSQFDSSCGGFSIAPKFPQPAILNFLLDYSRHTQDTHVHSMLITTLDAMAYGGMYDHIGGGFFRYTVDREWHIPHFEKMLSDNALLADIFLTASCLFEKKHYRQIAQDTIQFLFDNLFSPRIGFYSSQDADAEGKEGLFYTWTRTEINQALPQNEADLFAKVFSVCSEGNFTPHESYLTGQNILRIDPEHHTLFSTLDPERIALWKQLLGSIRSKRIAPSTDTKVITASNALMITTLSHAYTVFGNKTYLDTAITTANTLLSSFNTKNELVRIIGSTSNGQKGFLDDYAYLIYGLIKLSEASEDNQWMTHAYNLTERMISLFWDEYQGGFFFNHQGHATPITRLKPGIDGAALSSNAVAALDLLLLSSFYNKPDYKHAARVIGSFFSGEVMRNTPSYAGFLTYYLYEQYHEEKLFSS